MKKITLLFFLLSISCFSQIDENLLLYYKFEGNALDATENGFDGFENNISYVADRFGNENSAAYFNGLDSFIDFPNLEVLKPQLPVSFSFWIKYDSSDYRDRALFNTSFEEDISSGIFFNAQAASGRYSIAYGDGSPYYSPNSRRSYNSYKSVINDEWHNITVVVEGSQNMQIFIGCKDFGGSYSGFGGDLFYSATPGSLGRHDRELDFPADYFKGSLDEFKYWDRALSQVEILSYCDTLGIQIINEQSVILFPNPAQDVFYVNGRGDRIATIEIFDSFGKKLLSYPFQQESDIRSLPNGIYFVRLIGETTVNTKKLIIKR